MSIFGGELSPFERGLVILIVFVLVIVLMISVFKKAVGDISNMAEYLTGLMAIVWGISKINTGGPRRGGVQKSSAESYKILESSPLGSPKGDHLHDKQADEIYNIYNAISGGGDNEETENHKLRMDNLRNLYREFMGNMKTDPTNNSIFDDKLTKYSHPADMKKIIGFHFADWCGYCKETKPIWQEIISDDSAHPEIGFVAINEEKNRTHFISTIPALVKYNVGDAATNNDDIEIYRGATNKNDILDWMLNN